MWKELWNEMKKIEERRWNLFRLINENEKFDAVYLFIWLLNDDDDGDDEYDFEFDFEQLTLMLHSTLILLC